LKNKAVKLYRWPLKKLLMSPGIVRLPQISQERLWLMKFIANLCMFLERQLLA